MIARLEGGTLVVEVADEAETDRFGRALASVLRSGDVLAMVGPLGAGKTRLSRSIAEALGADPSMISSPTFVLVHEYPTEPTIYHYDAYRLEGAGEFEAIGAGEILGVEGIALVEWADRVAESLPESSWRLAIEGTDPSRTIHLEGPDPSILRTIVERLDASDRTPEIR